MEVATEGARTLHEPVNVPGNPATPPGKNTCLDISVILFYWFSYLRISLFCSCVDPKGGRMNRKLCFTALIPMEKCAFSVPHFYHLRISFSFVSIKHFHYMLSITEN
jgi:hypothetical protein